jgi:hypothetical protein
MVYRSTELGGTISPRADTHFRDVQSSIASGPIRQQQNRASAAPLRS